MFIIAINTNTKSFVLEWKRNQNYKNQTSWILNVLNSFYFVQLEFTMSNKKKITKMRRKPQKNGQVLLIEQYVPIFFFFLTKLMRFCQITLDFNKADEILSNYSVCLTFYIKINPCLLSKNRCSKKKRDSMFRGVGDIGHFVPPPLMFIRTNSLKIAVSVKKVKWNTYQGC